MATLTTTVRFSKPTVGGDTGPLWANYTNSDWDYADQAINQQVSVAVADVNVTLLADGSSGDQARYLTYVFTGALTANRNATLPANVKTGWVINNTTGGFSIVLTAGGTTVSVTNDGYRRLFYCDGSNVSLPSIALTLFKATGLSNDASGNLYFNATVLNPISSGLLGMTQAASNGSIILNSSGTPLSVGINTASGTLENFFTGGGSLVGSISTASGSTAYNTTSDERLKIDDGLVPRRWASDTIDLLVPRMFRWKTAPDDESQPGFFAQEVSAVFPYAVTAGSGTPGDEDFKPWQMDAAKLMSVVVSALQALREDRDIFQREMQSLRSRLARLEGG